MNQVKFIKICIESTRHNGPMQCLGANLHLQAVFWQESIFHLTLYENLSKPVISKIQILMRHTLGLYRGFLLIYLSVYSLSVKYP